MVCLVGVYAPSDSKSHTDFLLKVKDYFTQSMILLGDFNSVVASSDRISGNLDPTSSQLNMLLLDWELIEPSGPHLTTFTYHHASDPRQKSQID